MMIPERLLLLFAHKRIPEQYDPDHDQDHRPEIPEIYAWHITYNKEYYAQGNQYQTGD
jgi:hypothetical protein